MKFLQVFETSSISQGKLFFYFLEFFGFTFHFRPFQAKKIFSKNFHYEFTLFICGFVVDQFFWEPPGRFLLTERKNHRFLRELWCWLFLPTRSWEPSHRKGLDEVVAELGGKEEIIVSQTRGLLTSFWWCHNLASRIFNCLHPPWHYQRKLIKGG